MGEYGVLVALALVLVPIDVARAVATDPAPGQRRADGHFVQGDGGPDAGDLHDGRPAEQRQRRVEEAVVRRVRYPTLRGDIGDGVVLQAVAVEVVDTGGEFEAITHVPEEL